MNIHRLKWERELEELRMKISDLYDELEIHREWRLHHGILIVDEKEDQISNAIVFLQTEAKVLHERLVEDSKWISHVESMVAGGKIERDRTKC